MKKLSGLIVALVVLLSALFIPSMTAQADAVFTGNEWTGNPGIFQIGGLNPRAHYYTYESEAKAIESYTMKPENSAYYQTLNGAWKFNFAANPASRPWPGAGVTFEKNGFDASGWDDMQVPSNWQLNWNSDGSFKYDHIIYTNITYPWTAYGNSTNVATSNGGAAPTVFNGVGTYRRTFTVPQTWLDQNRAITLNFDGADSFYVWINGHAVGYSEDTMTHHEFDISPYLLPGDNANVIAVQVIRWTTSSWVEDQDFLRISGIFRDIYMMARQNVNVFDVEAKVTPVVAGEYNGDWKLDVNTLLRDFAATATPDRNDTRVYAKLIDAQGNTIASGDNVGTFGTITTPTATGNAISFGQGFRELSFEGSRIPFSFTVSSPKLWSAEHPNLYKLIVRVGDEYTCIRIGFRQIEYSTGANARMTINGKQILFHGTNAHEMHPTSGRTLTTEMIKQDLQIMKANNINALRMAHYPHDTRWYDLCDEYGIYVCDEANMESHGTQAFTNLATFGPMIRDRQFNMLERDKNYPSVVIWSMGNESGGGTTFRSYGPVPIKTRDASRPIHAEFDNTGADLYSAMYSSASSWRSTANSQTKPAMLCEYVHNMGNSNGNWDAYIAAFEERSKAIGGFIWDWVDQSIYTPFSATLDLGKFATDAKNPTLKPYGTNGTIETAPVGYDAGKKAINGFVKFPDIEAHQLTNNFTVDVDIYSTSPVTGSGGNYTILGKGDNQYMIKEVNNAVQWFVYAGGGWRTLSYTKPANYANKWQRLTGTFQNNTLILYVDGVQVATQSTTGTITNTSYGISVGDCEQNNGRTYSGYIGNARVLDRALTAGEVASGGNRVPVQTEANEVFRLDLGEVSYIPPRDGTYLGVGGDWGDNPNDGNFNGNGILLADRTPKPSIAEMKRMYQMLKVSLVNNNTYEVMNKFLFSNANEFVMDWDLSENGTVIQSGSNVTLDVDPSPSVISDNNKATKKQFAVPFTVPANIKPGAEYFFNVRFRLKSASTWGGQIGHIIAENQMPITFAGTPGSSTAGILAEKLIADTTATHFTVTGKDFAINFDRANGVIDSFKYKGRDLLVSGPEPNFFRAPTDNNKGSSEASWYSSWKTVGSNRTRGTATMEKVDNLVIITAPATFSGKSATFTTTYTIYPNGEVKVAQRYVFGTLSNDAARRVAEIGSMMVLPSDFENITWYGRGPGESYIDRKWGNDVGIWNSTVTDNYIQYNEAQETGNKVDIRWYALTDNAGFGMLVKAGKFTGNVYSSGNPSNVLEVNALHYSPNELSTTANYHPYELVGDDGKIFLRVNLGSVGVGGDNSWGAQPLSQYQVNASGKTYNYNYTIVPVENFNTVEAGNFFREVRNYYTNLQEFIAECDALGYTDITAPAKAVTSAAGELAALKAYNTLKAAKYARENQIVVQGGETVSVPIMLNNVEKGAAVRGSISYDESKLTLQSISGAKGFTLYGVGNNFVALSDSGLGVSGDVVIGYAVFTATAGLTDDELTSISFPEEGLTVYNDTPELIQATLYPAEVLILAEPPLPGDLNFDGVVDLADAIMLMQYLSGNTPLTDRQLKAADVNSDANVNVGDVIIIMQMCL